MFDPSGGYLGAVAAPAGARILAASGDRVWTLELGELDEIWLVAYELSRTG